MNKNNTHSFHLQNLNKNTNDYYDILINIYLIVDRKKNTTLIVFAMDAPFSRYPNMSLPARIHDSVNIAAKDTTDFINKIEFLQLMRY